MFLLKAIIIAITIYLGCAMGFFLCFLFMNYSVKITDHKTGEERYPTGKEKVLVCFLAGLLWIVGVWQSRGEN